MFWVVRHLRHDPKRKILILKLQDQYGHSISAVERRTCVSRWKRIYWPSHTLYYDDVRKQFGFHPGFYFTGKMLREAKLRAQELRASLLDPFTPPDPSGTAATAS